MGKTVAAVGTAIIIGGAILATGGAVLIPAAAGGGLFGALGTAAFGITASQFIAAGSLLVSAGQALDKPKVATSAYTTDWLADTDQAIPFAFGRVGLAGLVVNKEEYGEGADQENNFTICGVVSGAGPIKSFVEFTADDKLVTFNGADMATSPAEWSPDRMYFSTKLGTQPDTALAKASGISGTLPNWGSDYKMSGKACYMLTFVQDKKATAYPDGEPDPVMVIEGLYAWDPRLDSTYPGGSGSCRLNNPATWVYQNNGAIFALKWALGLWEDPTGKGAPGVGTCVGGIGSTLDGIDVAQFVYAANVADANGWTCAAWPTTKEDKHVVLDNLLQSAGAVSSRKAGLISCISRGAPQASILTVTAADTAGPIELDAAMPRLDRINTITPRYWSEAHNWQMVQAGAVSVSTYVTEDDGRRPRGVDYPYVPGATQAAVLAAFDIVDSREGISGTIPFKTHMRRIQPGDCFTITEPGFVLDGLKVKCWGRAFDPQSGVVRIRFRSDTDAKYAFALGETGVPPPAPSLTVTDPTVVPAPLLGDWTLTGDTLTENGLSVPIIRFDGSCSNPMADAVVFEYRPVDTPVRPWAGAGIEGPQITRKEVNQTTPGTSYEGSVQYRVAGVLGARRILGPVTSGVFSDGSSGSIVAKEILTDIGVGNPAVFTALPATTAAGTHIIEIGGTAESAQDGIQLFATYSASIWVAVNGGAATQLGAAMTGAPVDAVAVYLSRSYTVAPGDSVVFSARISGGGAATSSTGAFLGNIKDTKSA